MKICVILLLGLVLTAQGSRQRTKSAYFEERDGILVPTGTHSTTRRPIGRIVGGGDAEMGSAPWMVSLQWGLVRPSHFCGGAIINQNWILTGKSPRRPHLKYSDDNVIKFFPFITSWTLR